MSKQLRKSGANSKHPSKQEHSGVVTHCSSAAQQFSRKQDWQPGTTGPSQIDGQSPEDGSPEGSGNVSQELSSPAVGLALVEDDVVSPDVVTAAEPTSVLPASDPVLVERFAPLDDDALPVDAASSPKEAVTGQPSRQPTNPEKINRRRISPEPEPPGESERGSPQTPWRSCAPSRACPTGTTRLRAARWTRRGALPWETEPDSGAAG